MTLLRTIFGASLLASITFSAPARAQSQGELVLYSDMAFRGQAYAVTGPREHVSAPFVVRSAKVARGSTWQVCTDDAYRGQCNIVSDDQGNIAWRVRSARPLQGVPGPVAPGNARSLRGMSAEFFPQPSIRGSRVLSCTSGTAACATQAADRFCKAQGWTASSYDRQETVRGRIYLADVLCTRTRNN